MIRPNAWLATGLTLALLGITPAVRAEDDDSGVPYWVSLRKEQSNLRVGPGREYRISWVYVRKGLPMKVLRTMGGWRLVEDPDGARGWMLAQFLTRDRAGIVRGAVAEVRERKDGSGRLLWRAAPKVIVAIDKCADGWCKVDLGQGRQGYMAETALWGGGRP